jgi:hypothetical protein
MIKRKTGVVVRIESTRNLELVPPSMIISGDDVDDMMKDVKKVAKAVRGTPYEPGNLP